MRWRAISVLVLTVWAGGWIHGSVSVQRTGKGWKVRDAWRRQVEVPFSSKRVVSLSPAVTAMIHELGLQDRLIGVTRYCRLPSGGPPLPRLSGGDAALESLLGLKPDLVLAGTLLPESEADRMTALPLPVVIFRQQTFEDIFQDAAAVAALLNGGEEQDGRIGAARKRLEALQASPPGDARKALVVFSDQGDIWTSGKGSYGDEILKMLGLRNIAAALGDPWTSISREFVLEQQPACLFYSSLAPDEKAGSERRRLLAQWKNDGFWGRLPAVKEGRLVVIPDGRLEIPSLRMVEAAEWAAKGLREPHGIKP